MDCALASPTDCSRLAGGDFISLQETFHRRLSHPWSSFICFGWSPRWLPAACVAPSCSPLLSQELCAMLAWASIPSPACLCAGGWLSPGRDGEEGKSPAALALCLQALPPLWDCAVHHCSYRHFPLSKTCHPKGIPALCSALWKTSREDADERLCARALAGAGGFTHQEMPIWPKMPKMTTVCR